MTAQSLDGSRIAEEILAEVKSGIDRLQAQTGVTPALATVLVGEDPASQVYIKRKIKACAGIGIQSRHEQLPAGASAAEVLECIRRFNLDPAVHGILLQLPLPAGLDADRLTEAIDPAKDVDGFHPLNVGALALGRPRLVPCTPAGIVELLVRSGVALRGCRAVVAGRSNIVGKPVGALLLQRDATVTLCHSKTADLPGVCRQADILVAAIGRPGLITADFVSPGAVVVDVGINAITDEAELRRIVGDSESHWQQFRKKGSALVGDVEWASVREQASAVTPVPGGVGPLTIALLMKNTLQACLAQVKGGA